MGKRNSQLQELTVVAQNDYLTIVDTSAGQSKRVSVKTLVGNVDLGWVATGEAWTFSSWSSATRTGVATVPSDATAKYTPGMRVRFSQTTGGTKYALITAVTSTTVTLFFPVGTTFVNETITSPVYSSIKAPYGFNADPAQWMLEVTSTSNATITTSDPTWANNGGISLAIPVGAWLLTGVGSAVSGIGSGVTRIGIALSTSTSTTSDPDLRTVSAANNIARYTATFVKNILLSTATTYYMIFEKVGDSGNLYTLGNMRHSIRVTSAYLYGTVVDFSKILLDGGTTVASLYIIWQLIKDRDNTIKENTKAMLGNISITEKTNEMLKVLIERSDKEAAAEVSRREAELDRKIREAERS